MEMCLRFFELEEILSIALQLLLIGGQLLTYYIVQGPCHLHSGPKRAAYQFLGSILQFWSATQYFHRPNLLGSIDRHWGNKVHLWAKLLQERFYVSWESPRRSFTDSAANSSWSATLVRNRQWKWLRRIVWIPTPNMDSTGLGWGVDWPCTTYSDPEQIS